MRIAVLVDTFPKLSETFILNQITSLLDKNIELKIFSKNTPSDNFNEYFSKYKLQDYTIYGSKRSKANNFFIQKINTFQLAFKLLLRKPKIFFKLFFFEKSFFNIEYLYEVFSWFNQQPFDIIHAHFGPVGIKATNLIKLGILKGKIICSFHGYDVDRNDFRKNPKIYSALFKEAIIITGNSEYTIRNIEKLGCSKTKLEYLPESLRTEYFKPSPKGINSTFNIITVARLVEFKGIEFGIRAIKLLINQGYKNIHYHIVGDGELNSDLKKLANDLEVKDFITFYGPKTQAFVLNKYNQSDIFLFPGIAAKDGRQENQGLVLQEAQAMQLPVVASKIGGIPEGLINNETGILVNPGDVQDIANKIKFLINEPVLRISMGLKGRQYVERKFDSAIVSQKLVELYSKINHSLN